jgi:hypothetical protein
MLDRSRQSLDGLGQHRPCRDGLRNEPLSAMDFRPRRRLSLPGDPALCCGIRSTALPPTRARGRTRVYSFDIRNGDYLGDGHNDDAEMGAKELGTYLADDFRSLFGQFHTVALELAESIHPIRARIQEQFCIPRMRRPHRCTRKSQICPCSSSTAKARSRTIKRAVCPCL